MGYKKARLLDRIRGADARARYGDVHVFFGGTGAVGGTALLKLLELYEQMMVLHPPEPDRVPVLVATGRTKLERRAFTQRLFRFLESRLGSDQKPTAIRSGYLTPSGVFIDLEPFELHAFGSLDEIGVTPSHERGTLVERYLESLGTSARAPAEEIEKTLVSAITAARPLSGFLEQYAARHFADRPGFRYRSVSVGIPLPSFVAYHLNGLELASEHLHGLSREQLEGLKESFVRMVRDDLARVQRELAESVIVAHTTSVGGMYDEYVDAQGVHRRIRLGFAHSAQDENLIQKQRFAERLSELYGDAGIKILITAAGIGVDEVRVRETVPLHRKVEAMLREAASQGIGLFKGARGGQSIQVVRPLTVPLEAPGAGPLVFERPEGGGELKPAYTIRSGENGFFSVANAEALYRVMRVASASELGLVLATVGLFGDDPRSPWFDEHNVCYYTETDNSRQVFDFLAHPLLRHTQLSGLEPMALQDLGSAKHQGELHTLGLLILLHRLRTLDIDAIPPYVDTERFDARQFFEDHSRALTFEDLDGWDLADTARELAVLAGAERPEDLECLKPFRPLGQGSHEYLFPEKARARRMILDGVLRAVWAIPSLGSPLVFERGGRSQVRTGYFVAPLDLLVTDGQSLERWFEEHHARSGNPASREEFRDYHLCVGGFVDLRPHAILASARNDRMDLRGRVARFRDGEELRAGLGRLEPFCFFATCGLMAVLFRLRALYAILKEGLLELGTLQEFRWQMPRDDSGHILVLPGAVEALRMVSEGLEKTTGTEWLDGMWGYERRRPPDRRPSIPLGKPASHRQG